MNNIIKKNQREKNNEYTKLLEVQKKDHRFLYDMLKNRNPIVNISHKNMPSYKKHVEFIESKPYSKWYIIFYKNNKAGSIYLSKNNEIGIFLKNGFENKGIGQNALNILKQKNPRDRYLANVNPKNKKSEEFFKKNNFKLIQHTFELMT